MEEEESDEVDLAHPDAKQSSLTKNEAAIRKQLEKEIAKMQEMSAKDLEFKQLAETEDRETKLMQGEYVD